jgi:phage terminase large subunit GpA-like protein
MAKLDLDKEFRPLDVEFLLSENNKKPTRRPKGSIVDFVESRRLMPPDSPFPGFYEVSKTPYIRDIANDMSPDSFVKEVSLMKGVQLGATTGLAENTIAYYIGECPTAIMFVSATDQNLAKWAIKKLDPLLDSCELRDLIYHQTESKRSRKSGDTMHLKEFVGGSLLMSSAQSPSSLRQDSVRVLLRDEVDGAPTMLTTGEGNWLQVSEARTDAWGDRAKIANISTPTTFEDSVIYQKFLEGDQRIFLVPCPKCGKFQQLRWGSLDTQYGIRADTKAGRIIRVYYLCDHCHDAFLNSDKIHFLGQGRWEPTALSGDATHHSYHISALYSPVGMLSWEKAYRRFLEAEKDPIDGMRSFTNLVLGMPYKDSGSVPKRTDVNELTGGYHEGDVPDGVLFLTASVDLQHGTKNNPDKPPRLELEVCGHGAGYRTWSITHRVIKGDVWDPYAGAFEELFQISQRGELEFYRKDGIKMAPVLMFIDSTEGNTQGVVFEFCRRFQNTYPTKGFRFVHQRKDPRVDASDASAMVKYRISHSGHEMFYGVNTVYYKNIVYSTIEVARNHTGPQRPGFCDFPMEYSSDYFKQLTQAEERRKGGTEFVQIGNRSNEALDLRVLNLCAAHVFLERELKRLQDKLRKNGATKEQVNALSVKHILEDLQMHLDNIIQQKRDQMA